MPSWQIVLIVLFLVVVVSVLFVISKKCCPNVKLLPFVGLFLSILSLITKVQFVQYLQHSSTLPRAYTYSECNGLQYTDADNSANFYVMFVVSCFLVANLLVVNWSISFGIICRGTRSRSPGGTQRWLRNLSKRFSRKNDIEEAKVVEAESTTPGHNSASAKAVETESATPGHNSAVEAPKKQTNEVRLKKQTNKVSHLRTELEDIKQWEKSTHCGGHVVMGVVTLLAGLDVTHLFIMQSHVCHLKSLSAPFHQTVSDLIESLDKLSLLLLELPFLGIEVYFSVFF
jgi:hypothetical protein